MTLYLILVYLWPSMLWAKTNKAALNVFAHSSRARRHPYSVRAHRIARIVCKQPLVHACARSLHLPSRNGPSEDQ